MLSGKSLQILLYYFLSENIFIAFHTISINSIGLNIKPIFAMKDHITARYFSINFSTFAASDHSGQSIQSDVHGCIRQCNYKLNVQRDKNASTGLRH